MDSIALILNEALSAGPDSDGGGGIHPDAPGQLYKAGLSNKQIDKKTHADYEAYANSCVLAGVKPKDYMSWLKRKPYWDDKQKTITEEPTMNKSESLKHAEETLRNIQHELERNVEWPLTDHFDTTEIKDITAPIDHAINDALQSISYQHDDAPTESMIPEGLNGKDHAMEMVKRLRELSGLSPLANSTSVAGKPVSESSVFSEDLNHAEENDLERMYKNADAAISSMASAIRNYAIAYERMRQYMSDDETAHYGYGIRALLDTLEDMSTDLQKLG